MARKKSATLALTNDSDRNLDLAISQIHKDFGDGAIMKLGDAHKVSVPTISTGALALDLALGVGGVPRGRIIEIYGPESSGKTTLCQHIIANAQRAGGKCAFVDTEHALDPQYATVIGVDIDELLVAQPDCGEDALNIVETLVRSNALDVIVIDSVAALVPRAEIEGQMGDTHVGLQARLRSQALRKLTGAISRSKTCLIFTNQIREKIGVMFGSPETTSGGRALKFYSSIRMDIRRIESMKASGGDIIGNRVRVKVVKNKLAPPFRKAEFDILFDEGISRSGSILDVACEHKIVEKRGSWFTFNGEHLGQGRNQSKQSIADSPELADQLLASIHAHLNPEPEVEAKAADATPKEEAALS
jgi:recombination protein RecA